MHKFIIPEIKTLPAITNISGQDARHIFKVLRKKKGDTIALTDGRGRDYNAVIINITPGTIEIRIIEKMDSSTESFIHISLCSGILKDKKMDFIIKHITQLGVQKWVPFFCERSIPSPDKKKLEIRKKRWRNIAKESLKQCNRSCIPEISGPFNFATLIEKSEGYDLKIVFWEQSNQKIKNLQTSVSPDKILILIGPEGGFSKKEILMAKEKDFLCYGLGPRILRAETASIAACTLIQHKFGDL
jgi:16S rRNA (uracil1498-N3)-methyltransferase